MDQSFQPSDELTAAVLSDLVYHSKEGQVTPPSNCIPLMCSHDPHTGHYAEAWGQISASDPSQLLKIFVVNRGTVFSAPGANTSFPNESLEKTFHSDRIKTLFADATILVGGCPAYLRSANQFLAAVQKKYANIPKIVVGQSLGGAAATSMLGFADQYQNLRIAADTFNGLPYRTKDAPRLSSSHPITNFVVSNDHVIGNSLLQTIMKVTSWMFGISKHQKDIILPSLPTAPYSFMTRLLSPHFPDATVAQMARAEYKANGWGVLSWIKQCYPDVTQCSPTIKDFFSEMSAKQPTSLNSFQKPALFAQTL